MLPVPPLRSPRVWFEQISIPTHACREAGVVCCLEHPVVRGNASVMNKSQTIHSRHRAKETQNEPRRWLDSRMQDNGNHNKTGRKPIKSKPFRQPTLWFSTRICEPEGNLPGKFAIHQPRLGTVLTALCYGEHNIFIIPYLRSKTPSLLLVKNTSCMHKARRPMYPMKMFVSSLTLCGTFLPLAG